MFACESCGKEFETEETLSHHNADNHGLTSHEKSVLKRRQKEELKRTGQKSLEKEKTKQNLIKYGGIALGAFAAAFIIFFIGGNFTGFSASKYNLAGIPDGFVHWHADVDVILCGKDVAFPEPATGRLIGTGKMHLHDKSANIASLPGSDGNGVLHSEGIIKRQPEDHTLKKFMENVNMRPFSSSEILQYKNGDKCNDGVGSVKLFINGKQSSDYEYIPKDKDAIRIEFSAD